MYLRTDSDLTALKVTLDGAFARSRFQAHVIIERLPRSSRMGLKIACIRLRQAKDYCGQHPGPCPIRFGRNPRPRRAAYLEGADWVGLNDLLNDVCDRLGVAADIWSTSLEFHGRMRIRVSRRRRTCYRAEAVHLGDLRRTVVLHWLARGEPEDFADCCGRRPPRTEYPPGTPGLATWRAPRRKESV